MIQRREFALTLPALAASLQLPALAQSRKDSIVLGMTLEPPGLDPTAGAASAIAEVTLYNIFETLTKINADGSVSPLLAERWEVSPDLRTTTFYLRKGVKFSNGEPFNAQAVKFSFDRAAGEKSTNKDKRTFAAMESVRAVDEYTLVIVNKEPDPDFPFLMGQGTAIIVEPKSADTNAARPVGTGPYVLDGWAKGSSITLKASPSYRREPGDARDRHGGGRGQVVAHDEPDPDGARHEPTTREEEDVGDEAVGVRPGVRRGQSRRPTHFAAPAQR